VVSGGWAASMQGSLLAALAKPAWWALALAAFLVRGGFLIALLPIVSLPSTAGLTNALAPTIGDLIIGRPSIETVAAGTLLIAGVFAALYGLAFVGSWLDLALLRETTSDPELDLGWMPANRSATLAFAVRLVAHVPTSLALGYAAIRIIEVSYTELTSPGDTAIPLVLRILAQAPDAVLAVLIIWLLGEAVGGLSARRVAAGEPVARALATSIRQVASVRGLATLAATTSALAALLVPYVLAVATAWGHVRTALLDDVGLLLTLAAVVLLVSTWVLGLAVLGALLAWRATAWTVQVAPRSATVTLSMPQASEPSRWG
jgi:hypothetical protein